MQRLQYLNDQSDFVLWNAQDHRGIYFPLTNEGGMMSSVTPLLAGDCKTGQNTFLLAPASAETLHESRASRNFWIQINGGEEYDEKPLTYHQIVGWANAMENADGTYGGHWTMEQMEQVRKQKNIDCDPLMFYAAVNMMYSDYCKVAEKANSNNLDFYMYMAKTFLDDKDALPNKLARYYHHIAEK